MSILAGLPFKHSKLPDPAEPRPSRFFNVLPYRVSGLSDDHYQVGISGLTELVGFVGKETPAARKQDHLLKWALPELAPEDLTLLVPFVDLLFRVDDILDVLPHEKQEAIQDDLLLSILSVWKLDTSPEPHQAKTGKLVERLLRPIIANRADQMESVLKALLAAVGAQNVRRDCEMSFEKFKKLRADSAGAKTGFDIAMSFQGYCISDDERASIAHLLEYGYLSTALSNDYYSFEKEHRDHAAFGTIDSIHNAIALLMWNYGYDEGEAKAIVKAEILDAEKNLLRGYQEWEESSTEPVCDTLRAYLGFFILATGGGNYWQAISVRYSGHRAGYCKEDWTRSILLESTKQPLMKLKGYPPPGKVGIDGFSPVDDDHSSTTEHEQPGGPNGTGRLNSDSGYDILAPFHKADTEENCMNPYIYTKSLPGKNTLGRFLQTLRPWFPVSDNSLGVIKDIMTMLFTSSLMLDDIEDGSHLRRGLPAAHVKYGLGQTVNSATYLFGKATELAAKRLRSGCLDVMLGELETLMLGQSMDLNWTFHQQCPTVGEYLVMIDHKTGGLFRLAMQLMQADADVPSNGNLEQLITLMGRYYQIRDDYQNLASDEYTAKKGFCDDLSEGKFSFPLIHLLQNSDAEVLRRLPLFGGDGQRGEVSEETKRQILEEMQRTGSLEHTLEVLDRLFESMMSILDAVEGEMGRNRKLRCFMLLLKL